MSEEIILTRPPDHGEILLHEKFPRIERPRKALASAQPEPSQRVK